MHYCDCKGTTKLQLLQRVFQRMLTIFLANSLRIPINATTLEGAISFQRCHYGNKPIKVYHLNFSLWLRMVTKEEYASSLTLLFIQALRVLITQRVVPRY